MNESQEATLKQLVPSDVRPNCNCQGCSINAALVELAERREAMDAEGLYTKTEIENASRPVHVKEWTSKESAEVAAAAAHKKRVGA